MALGAVAWAGAVEVANAATVAIAAPGTTTSEIGARIRWGNTGFEASLFDSNPFGQTPTLNPGGTPVWQLNVPYQFSVGFESSTGVLSLGVDFNRDGDFLDSNESAIRSLFGGTITNYTGYGFKYLSISGNESGGSTARSTVSNLVINGASMTSLSPVGTFLEQFYADSSSALLTSILITGDLTYTTAGTSQERPSWNFTLKDAAVPPPVPLPAALPLLAGGLGVMGLLGWRRKRKAHTAV